MIDPRDIPAVHEEIEFMLRAVSYEERRRIFVTIARAIIDGPAPRNGTGPASRGRREDVAANLIADVHTIIAPIKASDNSSSAALCAEHGEKISERADWHKASA